MGAAARLNSDELDRVIEHRALPESAGERPSAETRYRPSEPVDLLAVVSPIARGGDGPCFRRDGGAIWLTMRTPRGAATLRLRQERDAISAEAWGPGAEWAIDGVPELLGAHDDWSELDLSRSPLLTEVRQRNPGLRIGRNRLVFEMLVPAILEQKVTGLEAFRAWRLLIRRHGEAAPGPAPAGMLVAPDAAGWRMIPSWEWHAAGVGPQRSETVVRSSRVADAIERTLRTGPVAAGPAAFLTESAEAAARMTSLPGIGIWTAAEVTSRAHGDPDAVSVGDYHLAATVGMALRSEPVDDDAMLELLQPWAGQRQRVLKLIIMSGIHKPRRGPRITIQDHRRH